MCKRVFVNMDTGEILANHAAAVMEYRKGATIGIYKWEQENDSLVLKLTWEH